MEEKRQLCAIMFTDIVGYTHLMAQSEKTALKALDEKQRHLKKFLRAFHGKQIKEIGDGTLSTFTSSADAAQCAIALQHALKNHNFQIRIGLHLGDVVIRNNDVFGDGINLASRIEPLAGPGEIFVSSQIKQALSGQDNFRFEPKGTFQLKNVNDPLEVFHLQSNALPEEESVRLRKSILPGTLIVLLGAIALVTVLTLSVRFISNDPPTEAAQLSPLASLAVLPFENVSQNPEQTYFSDGLAEEMIRALSPMAGLRVSARASSFQFKGQPMSLDTVGERLGVQYILTGTVRRAGNQVRIGLELIDHHNSQVLWSEYFDEQLSPESIFSIQEEVASAVARTVPGVLNLSSAQPLSSTGTDNQLAYDAFLKGQTAVAFGDNEHRKQAMTYFEESLKHDPDFIDARLALVDTRLLLYFYGALREETILATTRAFMEQLSGTARNVPFYYSSLGLLNYIESEFDTAEQNLRKALSLDPNHLQSLVRLSVVLEMQGKARESVEVQRRSVLVDPLNPSARLNYSLGLAMTGDFARAKAQCEEMELHQLSHFLTLTCKAHLANHIDDDFIAALSYLNDALEISPNHLLAHSERLLLWIELEEYRTEWIDLIQEPGRRAVLTASAMAAQGNIDQALRIAEDGLENAHGDYWLRTLLGQLVTAHQMYDKVQDIYEPFDLYSDNPLQPIHLSAALTALYSDIKSGETAKSEKLESKIKLHINEWPELGFHGTRYAKAELLAITGQHEKALKELARLKQKNIRPLQRPVGLPLQYNPHFEALTDNPDFQNILSHWESWRQITKAQLVSSVHAE